MQTGKTNKGEHEPALSAGSESGAALGSAPPADWPVEARISHRIMIYAARRRTYGMNQMTIEDIVREELAKEPNDGSEVRP